MALYNIGDKVIRTGSKTRCVIVGIGPCGRGGRQLYKININGVDADELEGNLMPDYDLTDPFEKCKQNIYGSFADFSKNNTTFKIKSSNISTISSLKASKTLFRGYQFKPLLKFLNSDNKRILVADEVGLGKTIEAGHIMLELKARNEFKNSLIICPLSLQEKWKEELDDKFGLKFIIVEDMKTLVQFMKNHDGYIRCIINYEKIRSKENDKHEEQNPLLSFLKTNKTMFSLILCDEAHKLRNNKTKTYKGAEQIMDYAEAAIFLTATPIMISSENLYNLLHLLDSQRYTKYSIFEQSLQENKPFINALSDLNTSIPLQEIAERLENSEILLKQEINNRIYQETHIIKEHFKDFPLYNRIISRMKNEEDSLPLRSQLQSDILSMSQMNQIFSRTRKREVTTDWSQPERKPHTCIIKLHDEEQEFFDKVINEYIERNTFVDNFGEQHISQGAALGLVQKKTQIASSVFAYMTDLETLKSGKDKYWELKDAKTEKLLEIINEVFKHNEKKIIVFARFKKTLYYLTNRLLQAGYKSLMIHGDTDNRQDIINQFQHNSEIKILLSSEVGSEGLDMQFCSSLVNYDLPWNPMVVEQRIGRIDRFGQQAHIVNIYNLIIKNSIQEDVYMRLLERIGIFRSSIGDMEAILDAEIERDSTKENISLQTLYNNMEQELYCVKLSEEERKKKIDEIAQAFINEQENIKKIEEGLTNTLTNDAYFKNEINRILKNNAFVTEKELTTYLNMLIKEKLTTCQLIDNGNNIYTFCLPKNNTKVLVNFLMEYQPQGSDNAILFKQFINRISSLDRFDITFNQDTAYKYRDLIYVNLYNPIIQAALEFFQKNDIQKNAQTFKFDLQINDSSLTLKKGSYFLAVYQISTSKNFISTTKTNSILYPILFDISSESIIHDRENTERLFGKAQIDGRLQTSDVGKKISPETIINLQLDLAEEIARERDKRYDEAMMQNENSTKMNVQQTKTFYKYRLQSLETAIKIITDKLERAELYDDKKNIRENESTLRLLRANLSTLENEENEKIAQMQKDPNIEINPVLLSINLINLT